MRAAEMLVWMGDFNYRINCSYEDAKENIRRGRLETLLERVRHCAQRSNYVTSTHSKDKSICVKLALRTQPDTVPVA